MLEKKMKIKTAPHSKESEMMVLGCMLTSYNNLNVASDSLNENDFYYLEHKLVFQGLKQLYHKDKPADIHLLSEELKSANKLDEVGGINYLTTLAQYAGTSAYIEEYAALVKDKSILRQMINASEEITRKALHEPKEVFTLLDEAQGNFFKISQKVNTETGILVKDILSGVKAEAQIPYLKQLQEKQEAYQLNGPETAGITGLSTDLIDLDKMIGGFSPSNLMILAARPAMGKTALAVNIAENICFKGKKAVGVFSLEMSAEQLLHRIICSQSEVESEKIKSGAINGAEYQNIVGAVSNIQKSTMIIDDQPGLKITDLRARARRMKETHNIEFLVIDYLQLIVGAGTARSNESRQNEVSEISRMLKTLARELDIPILCLSQLSRKVEERPGHRPMMSDLRESGSLEQDSDIVMFLLRKEYYDPYDKPGQAELIISKNRHGGVGSVNLTYRKEIIQFSNYTAVEDSMNEHDMDDSFVSLK